jgi:hypothetical protein
MIQGGGQRRLTATRRPRPSLWAGRLGGASLSGDGPWLEELMVCRAELVEVLVVAATRACRFVGEGGTVPHHRAGYPYPAQALHTPSRSRR